MTTYCISLDDLDMALLPLRSHSYNNFLKKEYYEFQVMATESDEESPAVIYYKCHTCAVEVPTAFAREHAASIKHTANSRIASEAARRTIGLLSTTPPPPAEQPNARFCANCSTTVSKHHDKTKEHRVAVMHDKLLWQLMTAYVGGDGNESEPDDTHLETPDDDKKENTDKERDFNVQEKIDTSGNDKTNENNAKQKAYVEDKTEIHDEQHDRFKLIDRKFKIVDTDSGNMLETVGNKGNEATKVGNVNKQSNATYPIASTSKIGEDVAYNQQNASPKIAKQTQTQNVMEYVEFLTEDHKLVKVLSDNYQSFVRRDNKIECLMCSCSLKFEQADSHIFSVAHLNRISNINTYCTRKIDEHYSHCVLCNQIVKTANVTKHAVTVSHVEKEKRSVLRNNAVAKKETQKFEVSGNMGMKQKTVDYGDHKGATKHPAVSEDKANAVARNSANSANVWQTYPFVASIDGGTLCVICDCKVPDHPEHQQRHLNGLNHIQNVVNRAPPTEEINDPKVWRCAICDSEVPNNRNHRRAHIFRHRVKM